MRVSNLFDIQPGYRAICVMTPLRNKGLKAVLAAIILAASFPALATFEFMELRNGITLGICTLPDGTATTTTPDGCFSAERNYLYNAQREKERDAQQKAAERSAEMSQKQMEKNERESALKALQKPAQTGKKNLDKPVPQAAPRTISPEIAVVARECRKQLTFKYCEEAAKHGDARSQLVLAQIYAEGKKGEGVSQNSDSALKWIKESAAQKNGCSRVSYGRNPGWA